MVQTLFPQECCFSRVEFQPLEGNVGISREKQKLIKSFLSRFPPPPQSSRTTTESIFKLKFFIMLSYLKLLEIWFLKVKCQQRVPSSWDSLQVPLLNWPAPCSFSLRESYLMMHKTKYYKIRLNLYGSCSQCGKSHFFMAYFLLKCMPFSHP